MARIVVFAFSNVTWTKEKHDDSFVEGFVNCLLRNGNNVLSVRCNDFLLHPSLPANALMVRRFCAKVARFKPDLIIAFNNVLINECIIQRTDCPIVVYPADIVKTWFCPELIKKHADRYYILNASAGITQAIKDFFPCLGADRYIPFGYVTDLRRKDLPQDINISFVGSITNYSRDLIHFFASLGKGRDFAEANRIRDSVYTRIERFEDDSLRSFDFDFKKFGSNFLISPEYEVQCLIQCNRRFAVLEQLEDLDLRIFGVPWSWAAVLQYNYEIFRCFDYQLCVTQQQTGDIFNRSKISLNLPQSAVGNGFSWRVPDILASNSVLLSNRKQDLIDLMQGYADLPTYETPQQAREIALKLLKDDVWRRELVEASNQMIEDKCRIEPRLKRIGETIGVPLLDLPAPGPSASRLQAIQSVPICITLSYKGKRELIKLLPYFLAKKLLSKIRK